MRKLSRSVFIGVFIFAFPTEKLMAQDSKDSITPGDSSIIKTKAPSSPRDIVIKYGLASFYAKKFNGRRTANGNAVR